MPNVDADFCEWDEYSHSDIVHVEITRSEPFVEQLTWFLIEGYQFITEEEAADGVPDDQTFLISSTLLGSISEFVVYVLRRLYDDVEFPFIDCFRAADPLGRANFPLVDVRVFYLADEASDDVLCLQEIKTTRENPNYFTAVLADYAGLYEKSRLSSTAEHLKFDLQKMGQAHLVPRVNDCIGTCPEDSTKVRLTPTGVSCDRCDSEQCIKVLSNVVASLRADGWQDVDAMYVRIPDIEDTYLSFAVGEGDVDG